MGFINLALSILNRMVSGFRHGFKEHRLNIKMAQNKLVPKWVNVISYLFTIGGGFGVFVGILFFIGF